MMDKLIKMCLVTHFILFCFILFLFSLDTEFHYLAKWSRRKHILAYLDLIMLKYFPTPLPGVLEGNCFFLTIG